MVVHPRGLASMQGVYSMVSNTLIETRSECPNQCLRGVQCYYDFAVLAAIPREFTVVPSAASAVVVVRRALKSGSPADLITPPQHHHRRSQYILRAGSRATHHLPRALIRLVHDSGGMLALRCVQRSPARRRRQSYRDSNTSAGIN